MDEKNYVNVRIVPDISAICADDWNRCANPDADTHNPFVSHEFLNALEQSGCVSAETGWHPQHLIVGDDSNILAAMPCYLKSHSRGEYVFDHAWADAYERVGGDYYPKLQSAIPFTPVTGPRLLVKKGEVAAQKKAILTKAACQLTAKLGLSSFHITFLKKDEWEYLAEEGFLKRRDQQFHWTNEGYESFDDFLSSLASRKRKAIRKERRQVAETGIEIIWLTGRDITEAHWDSFYRFYGDTSARKWGMAYLNRAFFSQISDAMSARILLVMCKRGGDWIAGALNFIGGNTLYGRYWGALEEHQGLHFEACYYQAIEFAILHKLKYVEAGAQGAHKLARGYLPRETYSAHYIQDSGFRTAIKDFLRREGVYVEMENDALLRLTPFKKS